MAKGRKRWPPSMAEFKRMVALVVAEVPNASVQVIFRAMRRRYPGWAVTPHRVRKALAALESTRQQGARPGSSADSPVRVFPHDVVELRPFLRSRHAQYQWRGQVLRVAGYDDGEASDSEDQELPSGHCSVFWLGDGFQQWPNALTKDDSLRVMDRPWVLGDRVAQADDPRSLGTIVGVNCRLHSSVVSSPATAARSHSSEALVHQVKAVGGFRAEDWVAHIAGTRWLGKVEEAVYRVEVELCSRDIHRPLRSRGGRGRPAAYAFQVSSEGLQGLEPAGIEDVTPQELSPHFPGQRLKAPARLWRQAEWLRGSLGRRCPRRASSITGVVTSVECTLLAVRWLGGQVKDQPPPDEWVSPDAVRVLAMPNSSEGWAVGDHVQVPADCPTGASAVIVESSTTVDVRWANGEVQEDVPSLQLCPRPHVSAHDFLPLDFVARRGEGFGDAIVAAGAASPGAAEGADAAAGAENYQGGYGHSTSNANYEDVDYGGTLEDVASPGATEEGEILPAEALGFGSPSHSLHDASNTPIGVVLSVNTQARTAVVNWCKPPAWPAPSELDENAQVEREEVAVFELTGHPQVDVRLGDAVLVIGEASFSGWAGRVSKLREDACAQVELINGACQWFDVRMLAVVDDLEGSESGGNDSEYQYEAGSPRSARASSEGTEIIALTSAEDEPEWAEPNDEFQDCDETAEAGGVLDSAEHSKTSDSRRSANSLPAEEAADGRAAPADDSRAVGNSFIFGDARETAEPTESGGGASSSAAVPAPAAFDCCDEDVEPTDHHFLSQHNLGTRQRMAAVRREMVVLRKGLLDGSQGCAAPIVVRTFSSRSDLFRAMVVGPPGTPYAHVPLFFDLALPADYPREAPIAYFHANLVGNERLNPNLYVDGKVCLSLLGTWSGPAWDPERSTLLQVLVSIQGLVLVDEPYFNEPGHECDAGTEQGRQASALYNEHARLLALRAAMNVADRPPIGFGDIVAHHFAMNARKLLDEAEAALLEPKASESSEGFRKVLAKSLLPSMRAKWGPATAS